MSEHGIRDFLTAKRKAAERFGVTDGSVLPKNIEIEDALAEYQRLFGGTRHGFSLSGRILPAGHKKKGAQSSGPIVGSQAEKSSAVIHRMCG